MNQGAILQLLNGRHFGKISFPHHLKLFELKVSPSEEEKTEHMSFAWRGLSLTSFTHTIMRPIENVRTITK